MKKKKPELVTELPCNKIAWGPIEKHLDPYCPKCGRRAEVAIDMVGRPAWFHKEAVKKKVKAYLADWWIVVVNGQIAASFRRDYDGVSDTGLNLANVAARRWGSTDVRLVREMKKAL